AYDLGAPDALYCTVGGGVSDWRIDLNSQGTFDLAITRAQIDAAFEQAVASGVNQVIGAGGLNNTFYALSDGQTITYMSPDLREPGKLYQFSFERNRCPLA
ncbi:MAG: hypothetical protein UZ15_CFX003001626, partial [Chloroflexi bacterium OLB15]